MDAPAASWRNFVTCVDLSEPVCRLASCRKPLEGRRTAYCCDQHATEFERHHLWSAARRAARRRARWACERCGFKPSVVRKDPDHKTRYARHELRLQVNHIVPLTGAYRLVTCLNHQDNLEVLCHRCHVEATNTQRLSRASIVAPEA